MNLKIVIERGEDGFFVAHCPSLKSCWSQRKTREQALENIRETIRLYSEPASEKLNGKVDVVECMKMPLLLGRQVPKIFCGS